mmetsp:Transcript_7234/g.18522  ORF Transcript_7234/g.18522 Transcript_7234/m.18522 type:complete len:207 (-) Transcript_7234:554-1174(-)
MSVCPVAPVASSDQSHHVTSEGTSEGGCDPRACRLCLGNDGGGDAHSRRTHARLHPPGKPRRNTTPSTRSLPHCRIGIPLVWLDKTIHQGRILPPPPDQREAQHRAQVLGKGGAATCRKWSPRRTKDSRRKKARAGSAYKREPGMAWRSFGIASANPCSRIPRAWRIGSSRKQERWRSTDAAYATVRFRIGEGLLPQKRRGKPPRK